MYTGPLSVTGCGPVPTDAVTVPARVLAGQSPLAAAPSGHREIPATRPSRPGGREKRTERRRWSRSGRLTVMAREPGSPSAAVLPAASVIVGVKGRLAGHGAPAPSSDIGKLSVGVPFAPPLHGVRSAVAVWLPQSCGLLR